MSPQLRPETACVIFNPAARGAKAGSLNRRLAELCAGIALKPTWAPGTARICAKQAVEEGFETIFAAGGDGTVNEVLNGIGDAENGFERARLAVLPMGTMNVFARELRLPLKLERAWPALCSGKERLIDLPEAEFQNGPVRERRYFIQMAGSGVDARAVAGVSWELKKKLRSGAYVWAGLKALFSRRPPVHVVVDGERFPCGQALIGNGRLYGGSIAVFWNAAIDDGRLDLLTLQPASAWRLPYYAVQMFSKTRNPSGGMRCHQSSDLRFEGVPDEPLELDGELVGTLPATFRLQPKRLRVLVPSATPG